MHLVRLVGRVSGKGGGYLLGESVAGVEGFAGGEHVHGDAVAVVEVEPDESGLGVERWEPFGVSHRGSCGPFADCGTGRAP